MPVSSALSSYRHYGSVSPIPAPAQEHCRAQVRPPGCSKKDIDGISLKTDSRQLSAPLLRHIQGRRRARRPPPPRWVGDARGAPRRPSPVAAPAFHPHLGRCGESYLRNPLRAIRTAGSVRGKARRETWQAYSGTKPATADTDKVRLPARVGPPLLGGTRGIF